MSAELLVETRDGVEIVTLNRPDKLNAMSAGLIAELDSYFRGLQDRLDVRVVILRGAGRAFSAGLDLTPGSWPGREDEGPVQGGWRTQRAIATVMQLMRQCPQPVIALGHGAAGQPLLRGPQELQRHRDQRREGLDPLEPGADERAGGLLGG